MKRATPPVTRRTWFSLASTLLATSLFANDHDDKHRGKHGRDEDDDDDRGRHAPSGKYFRPEDAAYLRRHYEGPRDLPPGLRKKYYRTGQLPPGWEKRFRPLPPIAIERLPPPPPYCERGFVDGYAVVYDRRTRLIVDILDLVNLATGR